MAVSISPALKISLLTFILVVAGFAQSPSSAGQTQAGQHVKLQGELEIQYQDFKEHARVIYTLKQHDGTRVPLQFMKNPPTRFLTGQPVSADGQLSDGNLVLYSGTTNLAQASTTSGSSTSSTIPVPNTLGPQSTLVMLVNFQDSVTQPYTVADAKNMYFGTVNNFMSENSYGQTSLVGDVAGWFTIPESVGTCNMSQIANDAQAAATAAGVNLANYSRYVYAFPYNTVCGWAGSSYVGGNPSQSWINLNTLDVHVISHELGHAFGLWHAHFLDCGSSATVGSSCAVTEYGDPLDVMGIPQTAAPQYNAFQKERLGWLNYANSPSIQTILSSGTYTVSPFELGGPGPNALKILKSTDPNTGAKTWYYLESRQAIGFDSFLSDSGNYTQNETTGVLFHIGTEANGNTSDVLDMTPTTATASGWLDMALASGKTFQDPASGVTVTTTSVSSSGATVQVTVGGSSCTPANPSVSVTPSQSQSVASGTPVSFTATIVNNDSSSCAPATFNLGNLVPAGWAGVWNTAAVSVSPGKSGSATLTVTSPATASSGSYNVSVNATNAAVVSDSGSAAAAYVIASSGPTTVSVVTDQSSYAPGQTVAINVTVSSGTLPVSGASVTATVTPPGGRLTTLKGTTASNGVAILYYKLSRRAASGTYQIGASASGASNNRANSISLANATFTVQ